MAGLRPILLGLTALAIASPAEAQFSFRKRQAEIGPPPGTPPAEAEAWPYPAPDPRSWWDDKRPKIEEAADPLGGRRVRRSERLPAPDNGIDASTYRLWGLMPLQWQVIRGDELVLEVWTRPADSVRQTVTRVVVRSDGKAFVQARAGLACCEALIGRRVGFDRELPDGAAQRLLALRDLPLWKSPRDVRVVEAGASEAVCLEGVSYDITLVTPGRSRTLRRACDPAEIGEAADVLEAVLGAAMGQEPRFDVLFRRGADFQGPRGSYRSLIEGGGQLKPATARQPPPGSEPAPQPEPDS